MGMIWEAYGKGVPLLQVPGKTPNVMYRYVSPTEQPEGFGEPQTQINSKLLKCLIVNPEVRKTSIKMNIFPGIVDY